MNYDNDPVTTTDALLSGRPWNEVRIVPAGPYQPASQRTPWEDAEDLDAALDNATPTTNPEVTA